MLSVIVNVICICLSCIFHSNKCLDACCSDIKNFKDAAQQPERVKEEESRVTQPSSPVLSHHQEDHRSAARSPGCLPLHPSYLYNYCMVHQRSSPNRPCGPSSEQHGRALATQDTGGD